LTHFVRRPSFCLSVSLYSSSIFICITTKLVLFGKGICARWKARVGTRKGLRGGFSPCFLVVSVLEVGVDGRGGRVSRRKDGMMGVLGIGPDFPMDRSGLDGHWFGLDGVLGLVCKGWI
jgi:hypothetical protein